jgi:hypothetical protein
MKKTLRSVALALLAALVLVTLPAAKAQAGTNINLSDKPWSVGLQLGFIMLVVPDVGTFSAFSMEIPVEYTFKVGPGELAPHFGFMVNVRKKAASIALPIGARYKIRVLKDHPLYVWPLLDIGPSFDVSKGGNGTASGFLRVGAGISYLVHPNVELMFQPLNLGATFAADVDACFIYQLLLGTNFRF